MLLVVVFWFASYFLAMCIDIAKMYVTIRSCAVVHELIGKKWVNQIVVMLSHRPLRFNKISQILPQISPAILSGLLKRLVESGIIWRDGYLYTLTTFGEEISKHVITFVKSVAEVSKKLQFGGLQPFVQEISPDSR